MYPIKKYKSKSKAQIEIKILSPLASKYVSVIKIVAEWNLGIEHISNIKHDVVLIIF